jgi:hypothetical protein
MPFTIRIHERSENLNRFVFNKNFKYLWQLKGSFNNF